MQRLSIITRTSNRPNGFKRLRDTIKSQTYTNINHIVISDNKADLGYIEENGYDELIQVNRRKLMSNDKKYGEKPDLTPGCTKYSPHNLYFNEINITDGWILYIDDDNDLIDENTIQLMMFKLTDNLTDTLFIHQISWINNINIPGIIDNDNPPMVGKIDTGCVLFHNKYLKDIKWDAWKCGDFRVINKLWNTIPNHYFTATPYMKIDNIGLGTREDI